VAQHRHKRDANARRTPSAIKVAGPLSVLATLSAVAVGVLTSTPVIPGTDDLLASSSSASSAEAADIRAAGVVRRDSVVSRSERRQDARQQAREDAREQARREARREARQDAREKQATLRAVRSADTRLWTTTDLNLWTSPGADARNVGLLDGLEKVLVTGRKDGDKVEVVVDGRSRWVTAGYLADEKPKPEPKTSARSAGPSLGGQCANGSTIDAGHAALYEIHDVVCANWPQITAYGTWRGDGEHGEGRAIDIMTSGSTGWDVAEFLRANYSSLGIEYIIYSQKIWSVERSSEGWRSMSDRGSTTANHYDHVHVTVY
jgi:hypothetical protein